MSAATPNDPAYLRRLLSTLQDLLALDAVELRPTLQQAVQKLVAALNADKIDVYLYEVETESLVGLGVSNTRMGHQQTQLGLNRQPLANRGRAVEVFQSGQAHFSGHVDEDRDELMGIREALGVRSQIIVPLVVAGERRGVLGANSAIPEHFSAEDQDFLQAAAAWVGMMTQRAELVERVTRQAEERGRLQGLQELVDELTPREQEIAVLVTLGLSNVEIAEKLVITPGTVNNHVRHILLKMQVPSRARVAAIMAHLGSVPFSRDS